MLQLSEQQSLQFQLSLFSDLVDYTGMDDPVGLVERMAKEASVLGSRDNRLHRQIAQYFVNRLNFRLFDWGCSCVLFSRRLVRIIGSDVEFTVARIIAHWLWQVETLLSPQRSIVREAAELVERVSNYRNSLSEEHWRAWAWDMILCSCLSNRPYRIDVREIYLESGTEPRSAVAETLSVRQRAMLGGGRIVSVFDLARVFRNAPSGQIIPIVKYSHYAPWVDELERMKKRSIYDEIQQTAAI